MRFNCSNCGECCGPVPITENEFKTISKVVNKDKRKYKAIAEQKKGPLTCIFRDVERNRCSVYKVRPEICKMFGYYEGLVCPRNAEFATGDKKEGHRRLGDERNIKGIMTLGIRMEHFLTGRGKKH